MRVPTFLFADGVGTVSRYSQYVTPDPELLLRDTGTGVDTGTTDPAPQNGMIDRIIWLIILIFLVYILYDFVVH